MNRRAYIVPMGDLPAERPDPSGKSYSDAEMRRWMSYVPHIVRLRESGWTDIDFDAYRSSTNASQRELAQTDAVLFRENERALKASYGGERIEVVNGRHRMEAARSIGLHAVPLQIFASEAGHLKLAARYRAVMRDRIDRADRENSSRSRAFQSDS